MMSLMRYFKKEKESIVLDIRLDPLPGRSVTV